MPIRTTQELIARLRPVEYIAPNGLFNPAPRLKVCRHNTRAILEFVHGHTYPKVVHPDAKIQEQWRCVRQSALLYNHLAVKAWWWSLVPLGNGSYITYSKKALEQYEALIAELQHLVRLLEPQSLNRLIDATI